ncbi:SDR family NAD(P)-dependent oxidoreductase [Dactylosporangium sp. NPDC006015]|uniref:SDR family NAD(P)-dependent oxidoreductase n=1 Tax=Dactylosporangium sp. NPDC006015 TaxID=3154576 RepID=UPI0033A1BC39
MNANHGAKTTVAEVIDGVDLRGRTAIVTGGASGIGTETTRALAAAGARVIVAVRDVAKARGVVEAEFDEQGRPLQDFKTTGQGAATSVYAAVSPDLAKRGGQYLEDCAVAAEYGGSGPFRGYMPYARDPKRAAELWERSEDWVGQARKG